MAILLQDRYVSASATNSLSLAQSSMSKSIQRLSSGLRINSAADDPSGLAISERLRTQINGFARASLNAQDAISYFQTAEGALNETHSILQRMRELSIQAANGTLTSSDRNTIQSEVDQLKEEVDRIAYSTEFNTKKLLNGDASALWSSTTQDVSAVIRGKVREGNYELEVEADPGQNHVLKTDIFSVKSGEQAAVIVNNTESATGIDDVTGPNNLLTTQTTGNSGTYVISSVAGVAASSAVTDEQLAVYLKTTASDITKFSNGVVDTSSTNNYHSGGTYLQIEVVKGATMVDTTDANAATVRYSFNGTTWTEMQINGSASDVTLAGVDEAGETWSFIISAGQFASSSLYEGEKILIGLNYHDSAQDSDTIQIVAPVYSNNKDTSAVSLVQKTRSYSYDAGTVSGSTKELDIIQLDARTGDWINGSLTINFSEEYDFADSDSFTFKIEAGGVANGNSKLSRIDRFYDDDGNFVLGEDGEYLTIYNSNGDAAKIHIDGEDTLDELAEKINNAIRDDLSLSTGDLEMDKHIAEFVQDATAGTDMAVRGTIVIRSTIPGAEGKLSFTGSEDLLNALSLVTIQEPSVNNLDVIVRDAHTSEVIGRDSVSDNVLHNVISGVDVKFASTMDIDSHWDNTKKAFVYESSSGKVTEYLHVVDNAKSFQVGSEANQTVESYIGETDAKALGIDRVLVTDQSSAQSSIGYIDNAIEIVTSERSRMGAVVNRLEHTINSLNVQQENAVAAESRIRDLDIAKESTELAKAQLISQAATAMLAQANQMGSGLISLLRS